MEHTHQARVGRKAGARRAVTGHLHQAADDEAATDPPAVEHPDAEGFPGPEHTDRPVRPPSDQELTRQLGEGYRSGSSSPAAADLLYRRHHPATLRYARTCCRDPHDAEDLASEAFFRTFQAVRAGGGPRGPWRPYLLTVVRHTAMEWSAGERRVLLTADFESWRQHASTADPQQHLVAREDRRSLIRSFRGLPERWQTVLWLTLVEEEPPHRVAMVLGISPSGVTSLAFRAREGLRESYLRAHLESARDDRCRHYSGRLGASVRRGGVRGRALARHLAECAFCSHAYRELLGLNAAMRTAPRTAAPAGARG
ncbi:RNA polymerase sigma factor [Streptomyces iranensis]|uniref:RNA polymerase sigma factor (Sigma-70 family) n=1 Tax=Streptomyces iranensis TaxID=576784 RepID=A0A060ZNJ3_9ACTN|nr:sigma-70 family RNA polymerase sigma factor [Streptomyces iranensis]MBP2062575.1 RNA polymerase sigma factor (sigma-70 family) [Streptomyces iranensis]CDR04279.1 RNA polymerase, sigma-24 subunit, ECF subfamily [Streptomyces iranensis]